MTHGVPKITKITTIELCNYGCNTVAKYKFENNKICCSLHYNSCVGKRKDFSNRKDHAARTAKSLSIRIASGIVKTCQIKGGATRRAAGHYKKLAKKMQEHWANTPWNNNLKCPMLKFKNTDLSYQGTYEYKFLEEIEKEYGSDWIVDNVKRGPAIWYSDPTDGFKRLYISDFIIGNTIYEIKSFWSWSKKGKDVTLEEKNKAKLDMCINNGYEVVLVLNQKRIKYGNN